MKLTIHTYLYIVILITFIILIRRIIRNSRTMRSGFADMPDAIPMTTIVYEKDRTLLYGSLFLDKLNEQIKHMTDPRITYDDKRIDIVKYSDVLM